MRFGTVPPGWGVAPVCSIAGNGTEMAGSGFRQDGDLVAGRLATLRARSLITLGLMATMGWIAVLSYFLLSHIFRAA